MGNTAPDLLAGIGHNQPPTDAEVLKLKLLEENATAFTYAEKLVAAAARIPKMPQDEEEAAKITDYVDIIDKQLKAIESKRVGVKEPYLAASRVVDSVFGDVKVNLTRAKSTANASQTAWLQEQRRLKKVREEAAAKLERDNAAAKAAEALKLTEDAEKLRKANEVAAVPSAQVERAANILTKQADQTMAVAAASENQAVKHEKAADGKAAHMAVSKGVTSGAKHSLRSEWKGVLVDRALLDLNALRQHLPEDALQKAISSFVRAGGRELPGARIWEDEQAVKR